ncbi:hypothetical protein GCM10025862_02450 [Arsenicicoccus piscis]|uniref:Uncharacterized protein n=1 Tax=Arsenicicoccus piscis TaxID=673954 RepID=A0ABQ6HKL2_9MICO|nr:hypothetical protein GCM10025862_02450 [Arsenicicoccus piscis]
MTREYQRIAIRRALAGGHVLGQVVLDPHPGDGVALGLEPVGVLLLVLGHLLEDRRRGVVAEVVALGGRGVELLDRGELGAERELKHLGRGLADGDGVEPLHVRVALEEQDPVDQGVGVPHLVDREVVEHVPELRETPVVEHPGVQEVGVDDGELKGEGLVEELDDSRATRLHGNPLPGRPGWWRTGRAR